MGKRLASLDVFRGIDMWIITGGAFFLKSFGELVTGDKQCWLAQQMTHVAWGECLHIYDFVFPLFLFIAGVSWPYSLASRRAKGATNGQIVRHILVRTLVLVVIGLFNSRLQFLDFKDFRVWSVIGRVGLAWGMAALIYTFVRVRTAAAVTAGILAAWWALLLCVPSPDCPPGAWTMAAMKNCITNWVDVHYLTVLHRHEGGLATLAMPPLVLMGMFAGAFIRASAGRLSGNRIAGVLAGYGVALLALGFFGAFCLGPASMPIIKGDYTSTYSLVSGGIAALILAALYWIVDVKGFVAWSIYFRVIGANALAVYFGGYFIGFDSIGRFFLGALPKACDLPGFAMTVVALGGLAARWIPLYFLYRRNIFIRV